MRSAWPQTYLGLLYSEYPEKNGSTVDEMARRLTTSDEAKSQLLDQIHERLETEKIVHWDASMPESTWAEVKYFISQATHNAINRLVFE